jgi:hypothetical protein
MARPSPTITKTMQLPDGSIWDITSAESCYVITYRDQVCGIRQHVNTLSKQGFKYQKLSYTNLGNARAQVRRLNNKFHTEDFDVMQVTEDSK